MKLYHYVHCPFCIRVRMALGALQIAYESKVIPYNDEATPINLTGKKMLPIMQIGQEVLNESLDIIEKLDSQNKLNKDHYYKHQTDLDLLTDKIAAPLHKLAMPYWIWTPEFDDESRSYFQNKKEAKRGPFKDLYPLRYDLMQEFGLILENIEKDLIPFYHSSELTLADIILAAHCFGGYVVPEFQFSTRFHEYLMRVTRQCHFNYHEDFWK